MADQFALPDLINTASITIGGMSGALHATKLHMDIIGIGIVAICTGVGGGAIRDVMLGTAVPAFLIGDFISMAIIGALAGYFFARLVSEAEPAVFVLDSVLIGAWVIIGAEKALNEGLSNSAAVFLGLTTAVGGGLLRDVLCRQVPTALMPGQWVAGAAIVSALLFVFVAEFSPDSSYAYAVALLSATGLRLLSAWRKWITPDAVTMSANLRRWLGLGGRRVERLFT